MKRPLVIASFLLGATLAQPQDHREYFTRVRPPATVQGTIGADSHDSYVFYARKGQTITVQSSWHAEHIEGMEKVTASLSSR